MAVGKEIRVKIRSIQNTQKITKAMEMVAASKMRKAQERMQAARPYADKMLNVIAHLAQAQAEYRHPYLEERAVKRVGYIIVSTDRGLCGGLNVNMFRAVVNDMKKWRSQNVEIDFCTIGTKASNFFKRMNGKIVAQTTHLGDAPSVEALLGSVKVMLDAFDEGQIDRLFLVSNEFVNSMTQTGRIEQLVPVTGTKEEAISHHWDYLYEPDAKEILDRLLQRYVESLVYRGVVENIACEMAARRIAMKNATDNAGNLIEELQLIYNKARQAAITQEIAEIVGGAAAV